MHIIALTQEQLRQIGTILARYSTYKSSFHLLIPNTQLFGIMPCSQQKFKILYRT